MVEFPLLQWIRSHIKLNTYMKLWWLCLQALFHAILGSNHVGSCSELKVLSITIRHICMEKPYSYRVTSLPCNTGSCLLDCSHRIYIWKGDLNLVMDIVYVLYHIHILYHMCMYTCIWYCSLNQELNLLKLHIYVRSYVRTYSNYISYVATYWLLCNKLVNAFLM